ncbi:MAG: glutamate--tRNA ligase [Pseudomonadota bacterium]
MTLVRFAPSPTGFLHIGNARTALFNALFAIQTGGQFVLRLDDTDVARSTQEFADTIEVDIAWLGIGVAQIERQSARLERYNQVRDDLKERGLLYPCYETPEELEYKRKRQMALGKPPVYDRAGLNLSQAEREAFEADGRSPHWRFKLEGRRVTWTDRCKGEQTIDTASQSDPVLIREDGSYLYTLPSIIDDMDFGITDVIRGEDHVSNTGTQIEIFEALGATAPGWAHHNLLTAADGTALSKREGSLSLKALREEGTQAMAVASVATLVGTSLPIELHGSLAELSHTFDLGTVSSGPARFEPKQIEDFSAQLVHALEPDSVRQDLSEMGIPAELIDQLWLAVRRNCARVSDVKHWWTMLQADALAWEDLNWDNPADDAAFLYAAKDKLPTDPLSDETWSVWTGALKDETGRKGKSLFMPLRKALTGLERGPEMGPILQLLGREKAVGRLERAAHSVK